MPQVRRSEWHAFPGRWSCWREKNELEAQVQSTAAPGVRCPHAEGEAEAEQPREEPEQKAEEHSQGRWGSRAAGGGRSWRSGDTGKGFFPVTYSLPISLWEIKVTKYVCQVLNRLRLQARWTISTGSLSSSSAYTGSCLVLFNPTEIPTLSPTILGYVR